MLGEGGLAGGRVADLAVGEEELASGQQTFLRAMEETKRQLQAERAAQSSWNKARRPTEPTDQHKQQPTTRE